MNKRKIPILSIVLYVIAGVLILYTVWSVSHAIGYISEMVELGQLTISGNEYDIVNFYMANCAQYALFAVILFSLGWILQKMSSPQSKNLPNQNGKNSDGEVSNYAEISNRGEVSNNTVEEDDFADWFAEQDKN